MCFKYSTPSTTPINTADIAPFLQVLSVQLRILHRHELNYPDDCNLCLEGYIGIENKDRLACNNIAAASKNGSSLKIEMNNYFKAIPNK